MENSQLFKIKEKNSFILIDQISKLSDNPLYNTLMPFLCGKYTCAYLHYEKRSPDRFNNEITKYINLSWMFHYCVEGTGFLRRKESSYIIKAGDLFYAQPNENYEYGSSNENPWTVYFMHLSGTLVEPYVQLLKLSPSNSVINIGLNKNIIEYFTAMIDVLKTGITSVHLLSAQNLCSKILNEVHRVQYYKDSNDGSSNILIKTAMAYLSNNISKNISLDELSLALHTSGSNLQKKFKQETGMSPMKYFSIQKIQKACEILNTESIQIKTLANSLGYEDQLYFSKLFKRHTGKSPRDFQNRTGQ